MLALMIALSSVQPTYTVREVTIVSAPPRPAMVCTSRELVQGSGTVKVCERAGK